MTPDAARSMYRRMIAENGQTGSLSTPGVNGAPATSGPTVAFRILGYRPSDVVGSIAQGDRRVIMMTEDVGVFVVAANKTRILWNGKTLTIKAIDDATRRVGDTLIAYEFQVSGA